MADFNEPKYSASDVRDVAGLSYRQMNDWEGRGALLGSREAEAGWRKFSFLELFILLVCNELRRNFGVSVDSLRWLQKFMRQNGANHFVAAAEIMNRGMVVLLLTDLKTTFIMNSDLDIGDFLHLGGVRNENAQAFVLLKLNPLVNSLLRHVDEPVELKIQHQTYRVFREIQGGLSIKSPEEMHVLQLLRDRHFSRVSVETESGEIVRLEAESNHSIRNAADLIALIDEHRYQTVTVTTQDGKIVKARRTKSIRPNRTGGDGITPSNRVRNRKPGQP
jgi:hypothetical protein